jgi:hypothetical protein
MPELTVTLKAPKDPEEYLLMAAWALENRDRFDPNTVMDLALQSIRNYLADRAQRVVHTCTQCGRKTTDPVYVKILLGTTGGWAKQPYCPECAEALTTKEPNPDGGVRQG